MTEETGRPVLVVDAAFFVPFIVFCGNSRSPLLRLRRLDFLPRGRASEVGDAIERYGGQRVPVRRKGNVLEVLSLAL